LSSSDAFSDGFDLSHDNSCTPEPSTDSLHQEQPTGRANVENGSNDAVDVDVDATEVAAFWTSIEAFLASSSSSTAIAKGTGAGGEYGPRKSCGAMHGLWGVMSVRLWTISSRR